MPHTSKKKRPLRAKRIEVDDGDGWTRVLKSSLSHMADSSLHQQQADSLRAPTVPNWDVERVIPEGASVEKALARYKILEQQWLSSGSWSILRSALDDNILHANQRISKSVLFGSGSVTGSFRGWIERHDVALTQIAVFKSMVDTITKIQGQAPSTYAQELEYNQIDTEFLAVLGIHAIKNPEGFELLDKSSFAYTPGGEFRVTIRTAYAEPRLYLSHELDHYTRNERGVPITEYKTYGSRETERQVTLDALEAEEGSERAARYREENENECRILERFKGDHESLKIPDLDAPDHPFHNQRIYYRALPAETHDKTSESSP